MRQFCCSYEWDDGEQQKWDGFIRRVTGYGSHYEVLISSRSSLRVLIGTSSSGLFACLPDYPSGCNLSTLTDLFYNREKLILSMGNPVDATTVACALHSLADELDFD